MSKFQQIPTSSTSSSSSSSSSSTSSSTSWENINIFNKWTFSFANEMLNLGLERPLQVPDLLPLPKRDEVDYLCQRLEKCYEISKPIHFYPRLMVAMIRSHWFDFTIMILWALAEGAVRVGSPVVIRVLLYCLSDRTKKQEAFIWAGVLGALGVIQAVIHHILFFYSMRLGKSSLSLSSLSLTSSSSLSLSLSSLSGWNWKNATTAMIYKRLFKIKGNSLASAHIDMGTMVNYISNDVSRFDDFSTFVSFFYVSFLELAAVLIILIFQLNVVAGCAGVGITLLLIPIQMKLAQRFAQQRSKTAKSTDRRVRFIKEAIDGISTVKSYGWENPFFLFIQTFRKQEENTIAESQLLRSFNLALYSFGPPASQLVTFAVFWSTGGVLTLPIVFSTISLLQCLRCTMGRQWARSIETGSEAITSCNRIEQFLNLQESIIDNNNSNIDDESYIKSNTDNGIEMKDIELKINCYIDMKRSSFSYSNDKENENVPSLVDLNFSVNKGELLMVVGAVGSGKSSLLASVLGEMTMTSLDAKVMKKKGLRIAYCSQRPWILASSVYNNIILAGDNNDDGITNEEKDNTNDDFLNPKHTDEALYELAVENCQLIPDFLEWPDYDMTMIGERGVSISGGQKARLSMARAIYSNADLNLLDDPLSACDAKVGSALFFNGIIDQLVKRGKSVILATHQLQYLPYANKILVLSPSGKQVFYGTFSKLKEMMSSNDSNNHDDDDDNDDKRSLDFLKATNLFAENSNDTNNDNDKTIIDSSNNDNDNDTRMKKYQKSINIEKRHKINELKEIISEEDRIEGPITVTFAITITIMIITIITIIIIIIIIIITIKVKYL